MMGVKQDSSGPVQCKDRLLASNHMLQTHNILSQPTTKAFIMIIFFKTTCTHPR